MPVKVYNCFHCGAPLIFHPETQRWDCEYCDQSYTLEDFAAAEKAAQEPEKETAAGAPTAADAGETATDDSQGQMVKYRCEYCGAEIITSRETAATSCVYCQRPVILSQQLAGDFRPDFVLPFAKTREDAQAAFRAYIKKKRLLPDAFRGEEVIKRITGVYVPFWLYDCTMSCRMDAIGKRIQVWSDRNYRYVKTDTYQVMREGQLDFCNIPVDASSKFDNAIMDSLEPFDFAGMKAFAVPYLSGFLAEKYDEDDQKAYERARTRAEATIQSRMMGTISGYNQTLPTGQQQTASDVRAKYALLPVWVLCAEYQEKPYLFAMNGQTGKFVGNLPIDKKKGVLQGLLTLAAAFVPLALLFFFL